MKLRSFLTAAAAAAVFAAPAQAQSDYLGEVQLYANNYCPRYTIETQGATLAISTNQALFSLLGTTFGGNGVNTFQVPDLRGRVPIGQGQGVNLPAYVVGQLGGTATVTATTLQMPLHNHIGITRALNAAPNVDNPANASLADFPATNPVYNNAVAPTVNMALGTVRVANAGGSQPYDNTKPYLTLRFCTVTQGLFPSRN